MRLCRLTRVSFGAADEDRWGMNASAGRKLMKKRSEPGTQCVTPEVSRVTGPKAIIECFEKIPCNPCVEACPRGAIRIEGPITGLPLLDGEACNGCGLCIPACPGLAIFVADPDWSETEGMIKLPYEFIPLPALGESVTVVDHEGKEIGRGRVHAVVNPTSFDRTPVVSLVVPREITGLVRHFRVLKDQGEHKMPGHKTGRRE